MSSRTWCWWHDTFVLTLLHDAHSLIRLFALDAGRRRNRPARPRRGGDLSAESRHEPSCLLVTSFLYTTTIFRHDFATGQTAVFKAPQLALISCLHNGAVFYPSKDGTRIPMFRDAQTRLGKDGRNPTYLYGYGGFDIQFDAAFSPACWCGSRWAGCTRSRTCAARRVRRRVA